MGGGGDWKKKKTKIIVKVALVFGQHWHLLNIVKITFIFFLKTSFFAYCNTTFTPREILDIMEFRLGGLYLQEMRDLRGEGATLAEVVKHSLKAEI